MNDNWKALIGNIAPMLGVALGGPLGGMAASAIGDALGMDKKTEAAIGDALIGTKLTAEQAVAIKNADNDFALKMQALGFDHIDKIAELNQRAMESDIKDRQGARDLQISTKSLTVPIIAYLIVGSFIGMVGLTLSGYSHVEGALAGTLVGYLSAKCEQVVAFFFGSSNGSQRKDELLHQSTPIEK